MTAPGFRAARVYIRSCVSYVYVRLYISFTSLSACTCVMTQNRNVRLAREKRGQRAAEREGDKGQKGAQGTGTGGKDGAEEDTDSWLRDMEVEMTSDAAAATEGEKEKKERGAKGRPAGAERKRPRTALPVTRTGEKASEAARAQSARSGGRRRSGLGGGLSFARTGRWAGRGRQNVYVGVW